MNLDEEQRKKVAAWIAEGLTLSDIQNRLASELGVRMTYMEVRIAVAELKLVPKDPEPRKSATGSPLDAAASNPPPPGPRDSKSATPAAAPATGPAPASGAVSLSVDQIARPGAVVSGKVTFGDGQKAEWYFDEMGRLGLAPQQQGYRPPPAELQQFQIALESELSKLGL